MFKILRLRLKLVIATFKRPTDCWYSVLLIHKYKLLLLREELSKNPLTIKTYNKWISVALNCLEILLQGPWEQETYVNTHNYKRFLSKLKTSDMEFVKSYYQKYPQDLRFAKASHLYFNILKEYIFEWW